MDDALASLMTMAEDEARRVQQLMQQITAARQQKLDAESQASLFRQEAKGLLDGLTSELDRLQRDARACEEVCVQEKQRGEEASLEMQRKLERDEKDALQRESEVRDKITAAKDNLVAMQQRASALRAEADSLAKLQIEVAALRQRLGRHAMPLHRELASIVKESKSASESAKAEISRLTSQKEQLLSEVSALSLDKDQLSRDLASAIAGRAEADRVSLSLSKETLAESSLLQVQRARAARDGYSTAALRKDNDTDGGDHDGLGGSGAADETGHQVDDEASAFAHGGRVAARDSSASNPGTVLTGRTPTAAEVKEESLFKQALQQQHDKDEPGTGGQQLFDPSQHALSNLLRRGNNGDEQLQAALLDLQRESGRLLRGQL